jgi:hypothetical protein
MADLSHPRGEFNKDEGEDIAIVFDLLRLHRDKGMRFGEGTGGNGQITVWMSGDEDTRGSFRTPYWAFEHVVCIYRVTRGPESTDRREVLWPSTEGEHTQGGDGRGSVEGSTSTGAVYGEGRRDSRGDSGECSRGSNRLDLDFSEDEDMDLDVKEDKEASRNLETRGGEPRFSNQKATHLISRFSGTPPASEDGSSSSGCGTTRKK